MPTHYNPIVRFAVERRITMAMVVLGLLVLGVLSLLRLPLEFMPAFSSNNISVNVPYPSASPEEVERLIVRPLEDVLGTINGVETLSANASSGSAWINVTFADDADMDLAAVDVRDRIDRARELLPDDVERVYLRRHKSTDWPILRASMAADWDRDRLYEFVEDVVQPRIERLEGVAQISIRGLRSKELRISVIPARLGAHGVDLREVGNALRANHVNISGGYLREGSRRLLVRTVGELRSPAEIRKLPLRADGLRLGDVADVIYDYPEQDNFDYLNGVEALQLELYKASTANLLDVVGRTKRELAAIQALPEGAGLEVRYFHDGSTDVRRGLFELGRAGVLGGSFAILFMFFFLRKFRTTLVVAVAVPISLITTFVIIYLSRQAELTDLTINVMSLMGLMLAIGMLLDNSIVVIESIFRHRQELGRDARTAALEGTTEVAMPIVASTATTICVFVPLLLFSGGNRFSRFMLDTGLTVCIVMVASLLVSLTVVPMLAAILLRSETRRRTSFLERLTAGYGALVRFTLHHRLGFGVLVAVLLWGSWQMYNGIERSFMSFSHARQISLNVDLPNRYSVEQRLEIFKEVYSLLNDNREQLEIADVSYRIRRGGGRRRGWGGGNRFDVYLLPEEESQLTTPEVQERLRQLLPVRAGVEFKVGKVQHGPGSSGGVDLELVGDDLAVLELLSPQIVDRISTVPFLRDVDTSLESGDEEIHLKVNRERAMQAGLSSQAVAATVSSALSTRPLSYFKTEDREVGLVMQYREEDRQTLEQLKKLPIYLDDASLPISSLASFATEPGARSIERENRRAKINITANAEGDVPAFAMMRPIRSILSSFTLPAGYEWNFGRWEREAEKEASGASFTFILALLLIYMIMAALFENFVQPFTIMFSIPFAFIGVGIVMTLAGQPRSSTTNMGLVILAGIVVNNAIVLIAHINRLRRQGMPRNEAIILGGQHRLRPILMTAVTTILGLSPMVMPFVLPGIFGQPEGRAAQWAPVGLVILGGLTTSTFLTLLVTPTIYTLLDDVTRFVRRVVRTAGGRPTELPTAAEGTR